MKLFISDGDMKTDAIQTRFDTTKDFEESDSVLILPGGLGSLSDLLESLVMKKMTYVYDKDSYFKKIINIISEKKDFSGETLTVDDNLERLLNKMEEENGKINDGKTSKLL